MPQITPSSPIRPYDPDYAAEPQVHVVARNEGLPEIAALYRGNTSQALFEQQIKDANPDVLNWDALYPDTRLTIPAGDDASTAPVMTVRDDSGSGGSPTPAERVDQAVEAYARDPSPANQAALKDAIRVELHARRDAEFKAHPTGAVYDTDAIAAYGRSIAARHAGDPAAQRAINRTVAELSVDHEVDNALLIASAGSDAQGVIDLLAQQWKTLSPAAQRQLSTSPDLATLMREKVEPWVAAPYEGFDDGGDPKAHITPANDAAARLAGLVDGLPPQLAAAVVTQNIDIVQKITDVWPMYGGEKYGGTSFTDLFRIVGALGETPEGKSLRTDIVTMFLAHDPDSNAPIPDDMKWQLAQWGGPIKENIQNAIRDGASPAFALELARQLEAAGRTEEAGVVVEATIQGAEHVRGQVTQDLADYREMLGELSRAMRYAEGLPPEATQKAVDKYLERKGEDWRNKFEALETRIAERGALLKELLGGLALLPDGARAAYPDFQSKLDAITGDDNVVQALDMAASRDRAFLAGPEAEAMMGLFESVRTGKEGSEALKRLVTKAIQQNAMDIFADLTPGDGASVGQARSRLQQLSSRYSGVLGADGAQFQRAIGALEGLIDAPAGDTAQINDRLKALNRQLSGIEGFAANQPAGVMLRSIGVAASALMFGKAAKDAIDDPTWSNTVGAFGDAAGLSKDIVDLFDRPATVAVGAGTTFSETTGGLHGARLANWSRALGVLSAAGDVAKLADALLSDRPYKEVEAGLAGIGATGTIIMTLSSGPVGAVVGAVMVGISVFGLSALEEGRDKQAKIEVSQQFLKDAGFDDDAARILSDQGEDEYYLSVPTVPLLMEAGADGRLADGRKLTAEQTIEYANKMSPDELQVFINRLRIAASG